METFATSDAIAFFGIFMVFGAPICAILVWRSFNHQERMAMISRGMVPPGAADPRAADPRFAKSMAQKGFVPQPGWVYDPTAAANVQLRRGLRTTIIGIGLMIGLSFTNYHNYMATPGPWLIPGFIVTFVGLANLVNAYLAGGRFVTGQPFGGATSYAPGPQAPPQPPPPGPTVQPSSGPFGWRPGDLPEIGRGPGSIDQR